MVKYSCCGQVEGSCSGQSVQRLGGHVVVIYGEIDSC